MTWTPRTGIAGCGVFLAVLVSGCAASSPVTAPEPTPTPTTPAVSAAPTTPEQPLTIVTENLDAPWSVTFHDDAALISERDTARILEVSADGTVREVGVIDGVRPGGEGGLLGIAARDGALYVYSTGDRENRIDRYELTGSAGSLALGASERILDSLPAANTHNGGRIAFGPDGLLYATVGDAGDRSAAQDLNSMSGKILRMTPDGAVPPDNPFPGSLVYSYGHRNPQGIAWDRDGALYASEFGQNTWDELNVISPGGNYGWPEVEGIGGQSGMIDPVQQWAPADASPSGIAIADDTIFIANLRGERLRAVGLDRLDASSERFVGEYGRLRDVVAAPDGALWIVTGNTDGRGDPRPGDDRIIRVVLG